MTERHDPLGQMAAHALLGHGMARTALLLEAHEFTRVEKLVVDRVDLLLQLGLGVTSLAISLLVTDAAVVTRGSVDEQTVGL